MKHIRKIACLLCIFSIIATSMSLSEIFHAYAEETVPSGKEADLSGSGGELSDSGEETEAKILNMQYDPYSDSVIVETDIEGANIWFADVKKAGGTALKGEKFFKTVSEKVSGQNDKNLAAIPLNDKVKKELKISPDKTTYLFITTEKPTEDKTSYKPNIVIDPSPYKKIEVSIDYSAILRDEDECAIGSVKYKKADGTTGTYSAAKDRDEFYNFLSTLQYGILTATGKEKSYDWDCEAVSTNKNEYTMLCTDMPAGINVYIRCKIAPGTFTYGKTEDETTDWFYQYDSSWGDSRLYNYVFEYDSKYNIDIYRDYKGYYDDTTGRIEDENTIFGGFKDNEYFAVILDPNDKKDNLLYEDTVFTYIDTSDGKVEEPGFYTEVQEDGVKKYRSIREFGLRADYHGINYKYLENNQEENSNSENEVPMITIKQKLACTASDFGIDVFGTSESVKSEEGDSFTISKVNGIYFSAALVRDYVDEEYWRDSKDKTKLKFIFRVLGSEAVNGKNAYRTGGIASASVSKPQKKVKPKVDLKNDKLVIQNGYDYYISGFIRVRNEQGRETSKQIRPDWLTILPYSKEGKAKEAVVSSVDYHPADKVKDDPSAFTSQKITGILIDDILKYTNEIKVRKTVTASKPVNLSEDEEEGGEYTIHIEGDRTGSPQMTLKDEIYDTADSKNALIMPQIMPAFDDTIRDKMAYEYAVISKKDFEAELEKPGTIDFTSIGWAAYKAGKKMTLDKTKTKYKLVTENKASAHVLEKDSYILVRRKGYTYKNEEEWNIYVLASNYTVTKLSEIKTDSGTSVVWIPTEIKTNTLSLEQASDYVNTASFKKEWTDNGHHYMIVNKEKVSWGKAAQICEGLGGHLVTITSAAEQASIEANNSNEMSLWIGGYEASKGVWAWVTGEKWDYTNWGEGEPNNMDNEHYAAVWPKEWNDMANNNLWEQEGFICEWDDDASYAKYVH